MHQTHQQQQQPNTQSSTSGTVVSNQTNNKNGKTTTKSVNSPNSNATNNVAIINGTSSSPKSKIWAHNQVSFYEYLSSIICPNKFYPFYEWNYLKSICLINIMIKVSYFYFKWNYFLF